MREIPGGRHAVLAWQGDPELKATCNALGELRLQAITVRAFQGIDLPRKWNDSDRDPDEHPHAQLRRMFDRLKAALHAWSEVVDHLPRAGVSRRAAVGAALVLGTTPRAIASTDTIARWRLRAPPSTPSSSQRTNIIAAPPIAAGRTVARFLRGDQPQRGVVQR